MSDQDPPATQSDLDRLQTRYDALRRRRSVRMALALAETAGKVRDAIGQRGRSIGEESQPASASVPSSGPSVPDSLTGEAPSVDLDLLRSAPPVTVLVPVFDAPDAFTKCAQSLLTHTSSAVGLVFIDDASQEPATREVLDTLTDRGGVRVVHNPDNLGFVGTVNRGFSDIAGDVIVLNSDTVVGPRWVERLRIAAYSDATIASVTAFSDNAGAFSAPVAGQLNPLPAGLDAASAARLAARAGQIVRPTTPTGNGFCMYFKRVALDDVGVFDIDKYPRGYGEENDWSMRALARGWRHVVDGLSYVIHQRSASFGNEKETLASAGIIQLRKDHPTFDAEVGAFLEQPDLRRARDQIGAALRDGRAPIRPRVLYLLHGLHGGTPATTRDLAEGIDARYEALILDSDGRTSVLRDASGDEIERHRLSHTLQIGAPFDLEYRNLIADLLTRHDIDVLHIRHLMNHGLDSPAVAANLGIPVVLSVHDFYLVCPTAHLIDESGRFCGGKCTPGQGVCPAVPWVAQGPHLKHGWVKTWQQHTESVLDDVDVLVVAHSEVGKLLTEMMSTVAAIPIETIEHGRDLFRHDPVKQSMDGPIRLLLAGEIRMAKGARFVQQLREYDIDGRFEFHLLGEIWPDDTGIIRHGSYRREEFADRVAEIRPHAMLLSSITAETYSHTLTEAWAAGIPVIATDRGSPAARIRANGGGCLIDPEDPESAIAQILAFFDDGGYETALSSLADTRWPTTAEMADRYADLYDRLILERRTVRR